MPSRGGECHLFLLEDRKQKMNNTVLDERVELHPLLAERWSPRSFHQSHEISDASLDSLLEAARWSSSANNSQPWRFVVAKRGTKAFSEIVANLAEGNRLWAQHASALIVANAVNVEANRWATYDLGQSVAHLAVQAHAIGYHAHQMGGFNEQGLRDAFALAKELTPVVVIAIGEVAAADQLPERLRERETKPRERLSLAEITLS